MNYVYDFSLVSIAYMAVTVFFYRNQQKVPSTRNTLFALLLYLGVFFAVMDVVVVVIEPFAYKLPSIIVWLANALFLISVQLSSALFFSYCLALTGHTKVAVRRTIVISLLPFMAMALLILIPFGETDIFWLDSANVYHRGSLYILLYITTALYLIASVTVIFVNVRRISKIKLATIIVFLSMVFVSMVIQYLRPELLLNATAFALALTLIYHELEAPSEHIDALTGALNRSALSPVIQDSYEQDNRSTLIIFPMQSLDAVNFSMGMDSGDLLLKEFAFWLSESFSKSYVFRISGDCFAVLEIGHEYCTGKRLQGIAASIPAHFRAGKLSLPMESLPCCINSEDAPSPEEMLELVSFILQLQRENRLEPFLVADADFKRRLRGAEDLETKLADAIRSGNIEVFYQPLHTGDGKLAALEALVRIPDGRGGYLPTQDAVELAEKNGSIHRLGDLILDKVCRFICDSGAAEWRLHHIGVNLSALQFMRDDLCESVSSIMDKYGIDHSVVSFEITETASATVEDISRNMKKMNDAGFSFLLDDFGKGYANFSNIALLPFLCIKIDKMILWEAPDSDEKMAFLCGIAAMLAKLGLTSVCEGVETEEQAKLLTELGVDMQQGYLYSKPLSPDRLLQYVQEVRP